MLDGYKTYITGAVTLLGALSGVLTGNITTIDALNLAVPAILAMTVRNGIATTAKAS